jgi:Xaa-Pro aminopeptidase
MELFERIRQDTEFMDEDYCDGMGRKFESARRYLTKIVHFNTYNNIIFHSMRHNCKLVFYIHDEDRNQFIRDISYVHYERDRRFFEKIDVRYIEDFIDYFDTYDRYNRNLEKLFIFYGFDIGNRSGHLPHDPGRDWYHFWFNPA